MFIHLFEQEKYVDLADKVYSVKLTNLGAGPAVSTILYRDSQPVVYKYDALIRKLIPHQCPNYMMTILERFIGPNFIAPQNNFNFYMLTFKPLDDDWSQIHIPFTIRYSDIFSNKYLQKFKVVIIHGELNNELIIQANEPLKVDVFPELPSTSIDILGEETKSNILCAVPIGQGEFLCFLKKEV